MMKPQLIAMLTHHDRTVKDALEIFHEVEALPILHWGFKDVGLIPGDMKRLVRSMKDAGKTTYLEVVSLSEEAGLAGARLAVELGFDRLMGTVFFESIHEYLRSRTIEYYPFAGHVHSHPSILDGSIDEIVNNARLLELKGVDGLDLLTYRFAGDASRLLREVVKATSRPVVSAGSISSYDQIAEVWEAGACAFTIGSAFFEKKFVPTGSFQENIMAVWNWLQSHVCIPR